jgi:hypothetical protein
MAPGFFCLEVEDNMKKSFLFIFLFICVNPIANAAPVYNPNNGHWYERIDSQVDWDQAKTQAENMTHMGMSGHLATITSESENWWIVN